MNSELRGDNSDHIGAVVLAAGLSSRMGRAKMLLPWKEGSVIQAVVQALVAAKIKQIIVVAGGVFDQISTDLKQFQVNVVVNPHYQNGEMLDSLRVGLTALPKEMQATLIALGDQPDINAAVINTIVTSYFETKAKIVVPSYNMRRGHPWLVDHTLFSRLCTLHPPETMRTFLNQNKQDIHYVSVTTPSVIQDIDTPEDYQKNYPKQ